MVTNIDAIPLIPPEVEAKRTEIVALCRDFGVTRLDLFGSSTIGAFDPFTSDYDFLVTDPEGYDHGPWYGRFQDLQRELGWAMRARVDLIEDRNVVKASVRDGIERSRVVIFVAAQA